MKPNHYKRPQLIRCQCCQRIKPATDFNTRKIKQERRCLITCKECQLKQQQQ